MLERSEVRPYRVCVLGDIAVRSGPDADLLKPQLRKALAVLVAAGPAGASTERLADEIWSGHPPRSWEASLRNAMADLRHRLGGSGLENLTKHYSLSLPTGEVDLWHFWALAANADYDWTQPATMTLLAQSNAFPDLDLSTDLATAAQQHRDTRREVLRQLVLNSAKPLVPALLRILRSETVRDPYDGWIPYTAALAHARAGDTTGALAIIDLVETETRDRLTKEPRPEFKELRLDLTRGLYNLAVPSVQTGIDGPSPLPANLTLARRTEVGRQRTAQIRDTVSSLLALDHQVRLVLVSGSPGVGKTRFLAGVAAVLHARGFEVVAGVAPPADIAFGPFLTAFPQLRAALASRPQLVDPSSRGFAFAKATDVIENTAPGRPLVVALDDGHRFDSQSQQLLEMLLRISTPRSITFLVASRAAGSTTWSEFISRARTLPSAINATVEPLTSIDIDELVSQTYPDAPTTARFHLGQEIMAKSAGLPAVANALVGAVDPYSFTLDHHRTQLPYSFGQVIPLLNSRSRTVLVAAAVLGGEFGLDEAAVLTGGDIADVRESVIELLDAGLLDDTDTIDRYRLAHGLIADAIIDHTPEALVRQLHIQARSLATDEHQLAQHCYAAGPGVPNDEVAQHLIASGVSYAARGAAREAAREFRRAEKLLTDDFPIEHAASFAAVLDLSGAPFEASTIRARTVARAQGISSEAIALEAALAGLPEAERSSGDTDRVELLLRIKVEQLDGEQRFDHAANLSRQLTLLGRRLSAAHWAERAHNLSSNPDQRAEAAYVAWLTRLQTDHPAERLHHCAAVKSEDLSDRWKVIIDETKVIDQFELGELSIARAALARMETHAQACSDPLRIWHCRLLRVTDCFTTGDWARAQEQSKAALEVGLRNGIATATAVFVAQSFSASLLTGSTAELLEMWDLSPPEVRSSDLALAGYINALHKAGEIDRAAKMAEPLLARILDRPTIYVLPIVATLADLFEAIGNDEITAAAVRVLTIRSGSAILVGAGVSNLGPADRYLATITGDMSLLNKAIHFADEHALTTWSVALRHELASKTGQQRLRDAADKLAQGTSIAKIEL